MSRLILHIPHSSGRIPDKSGFVIDDNLLAEEINKLTDWYTGELFYSPDDITIKADFNRIFCDPERFSDDSQEICKLSGSNRLYSGRIKIKTNAVFPCISSGYASPKKNSANIDICTIFSIFGTNKENMGQNAPHYQLEKLPPLREKVETIEILRQTNKSTAALAELKGIAKTIPNQAMLINAIVLQEAKDSSEIENIITSQDELYKALTVNKTHISPGTKEVVNYRRAIFLGYELAKSQGFLRVNDIVRIQQELVDNSAGIRSTPGTVLKNDTTGEIVYTPPQDKAEILDLLTNFINHFNRQDDLSPLINLAILHYQFESIHPFYDGNGRTGRILNILYLIINELIDVPILYLSSYIIANKPEYYRLLNLTNRTGKWEEWIMFMLKAVECTSKDTITRITNIKDLLAATILKVQEKAPKVYRKELVELLFEQPYSKIEFVVNKLGVERKAASRYLKELESIGIVESQKAGRETLFINKELIEILKQ